MIVGALPPLGLLTGPGAVGFARTRILPLLFYGRIVGVAIQRLFLRFFVEAGVDFLGRHSFEFIAHQ